MKKSFVLSGLILLSMASMAHAAQSTSLNLGTKSIEVTGVAPKGTKVSALIAYTPDKNTNGDMSACTFEEDKYSPNGSLVMTMINATQDANGVYSVKIPLTGLRKNCNYNYDEVYLAYEIGGVYENLELYSDNKVASENALEKEMDMELTVYKDFEDQKVMYCDLQSDVGLCRIDGDLPGLAYHIKSSEHQVHFDLKDDRELGQ